jgi:hypothetical protein
MPARRAGKTNPTRQLGDSDASIFVAAAGKSTTGFRRLCFEFLLSPVFWILSSSLEASKPGSWFCRRETANAGVRNR